MTQNSFSISNEAGATFRADVNAALQALASTSKGNNAPGTPYAGQLWLDDNTPSTTVWTLKCYDGTDWIMVGTFDVTNNIFTPYHFYLAVSDTSGTAAAAAGTHTVAIGDSAVVFSGTGGVAIGKSYVTASGAIAIQNADNSGTYGAQGTSAVAIGDTALASGANSVVLGGTGNSAETARSVCIGGTSNAITNGTDAIAIGSNNTISSSSPVNVALGTSHTISSGGYSTCLGNGHEISGGTGDNLCAGNGSTVTAGTGHAVLGYFHDVSSSDCATVAGRGHTISGTTATAFGNGHTVAGSYATATGILAKAPSYGQSAQAAGKFSAVGDAQSSSFVLRKQTTNATQTEIFLDGSSARMAIASDTTWAFSILIVARRTDADNESAAYKVEGCIDNNAGTTSLVGTIVKTVLAEDDAAWDVDVQADDTHDALIIKVTGEAAKTINWVARVTTVETTG